MCGDQTTLMLEKIFTDKDNKLAHVNTLRIYPYNRFITENEFKIIYQMFSKGTRDYQMFLTMHGFKDLESILAIYKRPNRTINYDD